MLQNFDQALDHPTTPELAKVLSALSVQLEYRVETNLDIAPSKRVRADADD